MTKLDFEEDYNFDFDFDKMRIQLNTNGTMLPNLSDIEDVHNWMKEQRLNRRTERLQENKRC